MINMKKGVNTSTVVTKEQLTKKIIIEIKIILTLRLTLSNQCVRVDHAARIHLLNSPPMIDSVGKNKMIVMMTMMI